MTSNGEVSEVACQAILQFLTSTIAVPLIQTGTMRGELGSAGHVETS
jgi:hypothetical protein